MTLTSSLVLFVVVSFLMTLGNTAGYHRLLTHRSFKTRPWIRRTLTLLSAMHSGSPMLWVGVHRIHHSFSDREGDPHSTNDGFWYAHSGWLFNNRSVPLSILYSISGFGLQLTYLYNDIKRLLGKQDPFWLKLTRDLKRERFMRFLDAPLVIPALFALQVIVAWSIGQWWGILWLWALHVVQNNTSWVINSICHWPSFGAAPHDARDNSRDVAWLSLLTQGDSYHNGHHAYPASASHALGSGIDLSYSAICLLAKVGLASDIKLPDGYELPRWVGDRTAPQGS